jgi:hypothetical protein
MAVSDFGLWDSSSQILHLNKGLSSNLFFWRSNAGDEIDVIIEEILVSLRFIVLTDSALPLLTTFINI